MHWEHSPTPPSSENKYRISKNKNQQMGENDFIALL